ncbi:DUF6896 domain-containing protein [Thalassoglobus neptunius]|uniref:DUF6896 domain-containing protein n=1 Tax=Thalassoglobus neptunius TaxID=1938619 RepID=UPI0036F2FA21
MFSHTQESCFELIQKFVAIQRPLVLKTIAELNLSETELEIAIYLPLVIQQLPEFINVDSVDWRLQAHGLGVMFTNIATNTIVDAHNEFFGSPSAFDAWRLVQFTESISGEHQDFESWQSMLEELRCRSLIRVVDEFNLLYEIVTP